VKRTEPNHEKTGTMGEATSLASPIPPLLSLSEPSPSQSQTEHRDNPRDGHDRTAVAPMTCADGPLEVLKWAAIACMLFDHTMVGWLQTHAVNPLLYQILRGPGRISIPIFSWLIAYNCQRRTRSKTNYAIRLTLMALISEPLFQYYFRFPGNAFAPLALGCWWLAAEEHKSPRLLQATVALGAIYWTLYTRDPSTMFQCLYIITAASLIQRPAPWKWAVIAALGMGLNGICPLFTIIILATTAALAASQLDCTIRPPRLPKWLFYWFYPAHIIALTLIFHT
jgi:hypothetical protein